VKSHAAVAAYLLEDEALVQAVLDGLDTAPLSDADRALLRFVEKVNRDSITIEPADIAALHAHGWSDEALYDALTVTALFNFYNRWIDAAGVQPMSDAAHRAGAARMAPGYIRTAAPSIRDTER
jgi:uncharacterized peroxidase-related enzyme